MDQFPHDDVLDERAERDRDEAEHLHIIACGVCCGRRVVMNTLESIANGGPREIPCPRCREVLP